METIKNPKYKILEDNLRKNIISGKWEIGSRIPTETELCKDTGTSRATVRRALANIETEGLITRSPGRGTIVTDFKKSREVWSLKEVISHYVYTEDFNTELLGVERFIPSSTDYLFKDDKDMKNISRVKLLRKVKDTPFSLVNTYIPTELVEEVLERFNNEKNFFIYEIIEQITGKSVYRIEDIIDTRLAVGEIARRLDVIEGTPLFQMNRILTDKNDKFLQFTELYFRPDIQKISIVLEKKAHKPVCDNPVREMG